MNFEQLRNEAMIKYKISKNTYLRTGEIDSFLKNVSSLVGRPVEEIVKEF